MSHRLLTVVEGWTGRIGPFVLEIDAEPADLSGLTVVLLLRKNSGSEYVETSGDITVDPDQTTNTGYVYYDPDPSDLVASESPYALRFQVTDGVGKKVFFPNTDPYSIVVGTP